MGAAARSLPPRAARRARSNPARKRPTTTASSSPMPPSRATACRRCCSCPRRELDAGSRCVPIATSAPTIAARRTSCPPCSACIRRIADGKAQTAGLVGEPTRHYGHQLAQRGFVCLIPDYPSFGDYKDYDFKQKQPGSDEPLYASGSMKAIWNNIRAVDLLESLGYVDPDNIGVDRPFARRAQRPVHRRLRAAAESASSRAAASRPFTTTTRATSKAGPATATCRGFATSMRTTPTRCRSTFHEVLAAIAPRGIYVNAPAARRQLRRRRRPQSASPPPSPCSTCSAPKTSSSSNIPTAAHDFPDDVRERVYQWLEKQLK